MEENIKLRGPLVLGNDRNNIENLLIMLHGYGSNGEDLIEIAHQWKNDFPKFCFSSPNAPYKHQNFPAGYIWFDVYSEGIPIDEAAEELKQKNKFDFTRSAKMIEKHIYEMCDAYNLGLNKIFLLGFSQGSMMSIEVGTRLKDKIAGVLSLSGRIYNENFNETKRIKIPMLIIHGEEDNIIKKYRYKETCEVLSKSGYNVEKHLIKSMGHTINAQVIEICKNFISKNK